MALQHHRGVIPVVLPCTVLRLRTVTFFCFVGERADSAAEMPMHNERVSVKFIIGFSALPCGIINILDTGCAKLMESSKEIF